MRSSCCPAARTPAMKALCARVCVFYYTALLASWPLSADAARLRCGSDLLSDLIFVCGDRGIYLGRGKWSGYGARPRGKGIVDQCCRPAGCELHHLEMYCAKPKSQQQTTALPTTTAAATQTDEDLQFQAVFHKRLLEHMGPPDSAKREASRKKAQPPPPKKASRRRIRAQNMSSGPPSVLRMMRPES
ncbi:insulin-like growth factor 3 [Betta splendens]|uniref:Insulin-like growth factor 3 n=1 Tax=Betta splendens TaxID=158456 RepID=A0A6P7MYH9_BETSP|nr:insulin-like growth factor 3 [Betta splendens]